MAKAIFLAKRRHEAAYIKGNKPCNAYARSRLSTEHRRHEAANWRQNIKLVRIHPLLAVVFVGHGVAGRGLAPSKLDTKPNSIYGATQKKTATAIATATAATRRSREDGSSINNINSNNNNSNSNSNNNNNNKKPHHRPGLALPRGLVRRG